ncbi:unnamed protein product [Prorocentrum cordatum]|uniref:Uncharacterized protein n=1 Tax=Prorocentrum cordatum TaxID=2364126 RepID=A0ABN9Y219_9DINO|nr:unnamed protein product [Polarella glacialis]
MPADLAVADPGGAGIADAAVRQTRTTAASGTFDSEDEREAGRVSCRRGASDAAELPGRESGGQRAWEHSAGGGCIGTRDALEGSTRPTPEAPLLSGGAAEQGLGVLVAITQQEQQLPSKMGEHDLPLAADRGWLSWRSPALETLRLRLADGSVLAFTCSRCVAKFREAAMILRLEGLASCQTRHSGSGIDRASGAWAHAGTQPRTATNQGCLEAPTLVASHVDAHAQVQSLGRGSAASIVSSTTLRHRAARAAGAAAAAAAAAASVPLKPGERVEVFGLQSEAGRGLNGKSGVITKWDEAKGRFQVELGQANLQSLKPDNLRRCSTSSSAGGAGGAGGPETGYQGPSAG